MEHQSTPIPGQQLHSGEIDLFDLWDILVKKKWLIFAVTALFAATSLIIAYTINPVYQASVQIMPPLRQDAEVLNIEAIGSEYTPEDLYNEFQRNFRSQSNLWAFFSENELYKAYFDGSPDPDALAINDVFEREFINSLVLKTPGKKETEELMATFNWFDNNEAAELLNQYVQSIAEKTSLKLVEGVNASVLRKTERLSEEISALRKSAESEVARKIMRLEEAAFIARRLDIKRSIDSGGAGDSSSVFVDASGKKPYYYLGYETLDVELEAIRNRKSVDPFVLGLDDKLRKVNHLTVLALPQEVGVVRVSRNAEPPMEPIKPKKALVVIASTIVGGCLGVMLAFVMNAVEGRRNIVP
jgi:chain length determinant protein (polysaccharide antigen chain regulator)